MQENLKAKWSVTEEELKIARYELRVHAMTGNYQSTKALSALLDVLENGDVPAEEKVSEKAEDGEQTSEPKAPSKRLRVLIEDFDDGEVLEFRTDCAELLLSDYGEKEGTTEVRVVRNLKGAILTGAIGMRMQEEWRKVADIGISMRIRGEVL